MGKVLWGKFGKVAEFMRPARPRSTNSKRAVVVVMSHIAAEAIEAAVASGAHKNDSAVIARALEGYLGLEAGAADPGEKA